MAADSLGSGEDLTQTRKAPYICRRCGKGLMSRSGLSSHERSHEGRGPYTCCGKVFFSISNLTRHRCAKHNEEKCFKCKKCNSMFATKSDANRHEKMHSDDKQNKCDICDFSTNHKWVLAEHVAAHGDQRQHVCPHCGKTYKYRSNLTRHKRSCKMKVKRT